MESSDPAAYGLPHREPFIFVDRVVSVVTGKEAVCVKTFSPDEPFFRGHFPGDPLVPGVILTEALAQTAGIALGSGGGGLSFRLSGIRHMKFLRPVRPGAEIVLKAEKTADLGGLFQVAVTASVSGETAADGTVILNAVA